MLFDFGIPVMWGETDPRFYLLLGEELTRRGYRVAFITTSPSEDKLFGSRGCFHVNVYKLARQVGPLDHSTPVREALAKRYGFPSLRQFCFPEKAMHGGREELLMRKAARFLAAIEVFLDEHRVRCFIQNEGGEILRRAVFHVARRRGIPNLYLAFAPFPERQRILENETEQWSASFRSLPYEDLTVADREWAEGYIASRRGKRFFMKGEAIKPPLPSLGSLAGFAAYLRKRRLLGDPRPLGSVIVQRLSLRLRSNVAKRFYHSIPAPDQPYIFLPLHLSADTQITLRAPQFYNQEFLCEVVARSIPEGYLLVIKEHPWALGETPLSIFRRLSRLGYVRFLHPLSDALTAAERAAVVVVVNSTVGFESLMLGRPVVVLGDAFYAGARVTVDVRDLRELPTAIAAALQRPPDRRAVAALQVAARNASYPGDFWDPRDPLQNAADCSSSLLRKLDWPQRAPAGGLTMVGSR